MFSCCLYEEWVTCVLQCLTLHCFCSVCFECISLLFVGISWQTEWNCLPSHWYLFYFYNGKCLTVAITWFSFGSFLLLFACENYNSHSNGRLTKFSQITKFTSPKIGKHLELLCPREWFLCFFCPSFSSIRLYRLAELLKWWFYL